MSELDSDFTDGDCDCRDHLVKAFVELDYEMCYKKLQASDYAPVRSQERLILLASKIGLPNLPGIFRLARCLMSRRKSKWQSREGTSGTRIRSGLSIMWDK